MKLDTSCSEERMDRARRGVLAAPDMIEFTTHLTACVDCRVMWRLAADFQGSGGALPGDERIVERAARLAAASGRRPARRWVSVLPAAAALVVAAGVASGAMALRARYSPSRDEARALPASGRRGTKLVPGGAGAGVPAPPPGPEPAAATVSTTVPVPFPAPSAMPPPVESAPPARSAPVTPGGDDVAGRATRKVPRALALAPVVPAGAPPSPPPRCAAGLELLSRAVHQRNAGDADGALQSFRQLQLECPDRPESMVSLVSAGELLLERGDASEALASFDAYLRGKPSGTLAPEALVGEGRALARLGRADDAAAVWREVRRRFPESPYAHHAPPASDSGAAAP